MTYAQQPRYAATQRPQFKHQQAPAASYHRGYAAEYDYEGEDYSVGLNGSSGHKHEEGNHDHRWDNWKDQSNPDASSGQEYTMIGQDSSNWAFGRPLQQGIPREVYWQGYSFSGIQGPPPPRSRSLPRGQQALRNNTHQMTELQTSHTYQQPNISEGYPDTSRQGEANDTQGHEEPFQNPQDAWVSSQPYRDPDKRAPNYHNPRQGSDLHSHEHPDRCLEPSLSDTAWSTQPIHGTRYADSSVPRPSKGQSQGVSARLESSHPSDPKNINESPISPETLAWDNPFPTFPTRPKKPEHSNLSSVNGDGSRPQTADSKASSYTLTADGESAQVSIDQVNHSTKPLDQRSTHDGLAGPKRDAIPRSRENGRNGRQLGQLRPHIVNGRHSEDNRVRPSVPLGPGNVPSYERSQTMPIAFSEAAEISEYHSQQVDHSSWQEPGPVAGYFGPEDREFLPSGPVEPPQLRSGQPRTEYVEGRSHGQTINQSSQDGMGELLTNSYGRPRQHYQSHTQQQGQLPRSPIDEDMPNFKPISDPVSAHRRGMTIDQHLQPKEKPQVTPPIPNPSREEWRRPHRYGPDPGAQILPRSRSQPNLKDRRSSRAQRNDDFDFGPHVAPFRPPAVEPAWGVLASDKPSSANYSNEIPQRRDIYRGDRQDYGPSPTAKIPPRHDTRGQYSPHQMELPHGPYQDMGPSHRYRSPPLRGGHPPPGLMRPRETPSPIDGNTAKSAYQSGSQYGSQNDRYCAPPMEQGCPRRQIRPFGGTPSPDNPIRPTLPPNLSLSNPDALPSHPVPFHPGLKGDGSGINNQASKPAPVRNYNATPSPMQMSRPSQNSGSSISVGKERNSSPITHQELESIKQDAARKPDSPSAQLTLAKSFVEASFVLTDERADSRTRNKICEKYLVDAHRIVKKLSSNSYPEGTFYLADAYSRGSLGLESDTREAFKLYQTAAKQNHAQAAYRVAVCCEIGQEEGGGTSRDPVKAMQWYKRAATLGDIPAMYKMGIISLKGLLGQPKNPKEALLWLKRAAERADRENPHALHEMVSITSPRQISQSE